MATRRGFLTGLMAAAAMPSPSWAAAGSPAYLAAAREADGSYSLFGLDAAAEELFRIPLPARGHAAAAHPTRPEAVAFARRPGAFALAIDCTSGQVIRQLEAPQGRHFYGHGCYVAGGDILCTTENDIATGEGRISLWSRPDNYMRIGEFSAHGIGPHELRTMPDGDTLVIANGGIRTHPDSGRDKLNLDTMRPNLTYLSSDGTLRDQVELPPEMHKNSIRHLDVRADGLVGFAMQWQDDPETAPPLLGLHRMGQGPAILAELPMTEQFAMNGYAGSVAFSGSGAEVAITSPRGGVVHVFGADGGFVRAWRRRDVCGIAPAQTGFMTTDGTGAIFALTDQGAAPQASFARAWDNHLVPIG